ncbi:unnamed protein product [Merluccius merluccius]
MAELLEVDQSHLPRVNEVRQSFAVREDSVLAHSLQEQEIEQYYSSNVQKSQLVQKDIRVAKRLQGEEEQQREQHQALLRQSSRQLEEQDSEYARLVQEQLRRCAEETRRREQEDEEIAKRIQEEEEEEEEQRVRSRVQEKLSDGTPRAGCLDLGALQQVLQDEELARRLQEQEDRRMRRDRGVRETSRHSYHEGDFTVAQVAQDEEIARFMQKQEIKLKRSSRELEGPASWREHRETMSQSERRPSRETQDSEGLPSPTEDRSPDNQPPSPICTLTQAQQIRNIAEELDPTFRVRPQGEDTLRTEQGQPCPSLPVSQSASRDALEEPTFVPPTKRQSDKSARAKPKEKKESCKQQ